MNTPPVLLLLAALAVGSMSTETIAQQEPVIDVGSRPLWLAEKLPRGNLRDALLSCDTSNIAPSRFSIGHRGAPLQYPEHTRESYIAAARMGAGVLECDVTFTKDKELVCRHSQCDLHTTTNILETPLAAKCSIPPNPKSSTPYSEVQCCTTDLTLAEFRTLEGKVDSGNPDARTLDDYFAHTPSWKSDAYTIRGTLMTHAESIELFDKLGVDMTPELKEVSIKKINFSRTAQADKLLDEYRSAGIDPQRVWPQSFEYNDIRHWLTTAKEFSPRLIYLDGRYQTLRLNPNSPGTWRPDMKSLFDDGLRWLAPPIWMLVTERKNRIVPSAYAKAAKAEGLGLIAWTLERSGVIDRHNRGGWYYRSISNLIDNDADALVLLDVLARDVGVSAVFSDWPATTSFYAHCRL